MPLALIVEDIPENQLVLQEILEEFNVESQCADCVEDAVAMATKHPYAIIFMDLSIPRERFGEPYFCAGLEAAKQIRDNLGEASPPIVAVTARRKQEVQAQLDAAGITALVEKTGHFVEGISSILGELVQFEESSSNHVAIADEAPSDRLVLPADKVPSVRVPADEVPARQVAASGLESPSSSSFAAPPGSPSPTTPDPAPHQNGRGSRTFAVDDRQPVESKSVGEDSPVQQAALSLRRSILNHLSQSIISIEETRSQVASSCGTEVQQRFQQLDQAVASARQRLQDPEQCPRPGETYGHWLVNLLNFAASRSSRLRAANTDRIPADLSAQFEQIEYEIDRCIAIAKSDRAHRTIEPETDDPRRKPDSVITPSVDRRANRKPRSMTDDFQAASSSDEQPMSDELEPIPSARIDPSQRVVLIVDDEPDARRDLEDKLKRLNYRVLACESAATALMFLEANRVDVCLLDMDMPEINGMEMIRRIRQSEASSNASIIVVSGSPEKFVAADAIEKGADDYLEKPADERLLHARIQSCLRQTDARRAELGKFLPADVLDRVINNQALLDKPMPADVSVIVCDIRGFSRISERVGPVQTITWISDVMNRLSRIILHRGGTIIDYVGDEIMAMWGAPIASQDHASDACNCAMAIQQAAEVLSQKWYPTINTDLRIGIGINSGLAVVGNTGSKHRIKYGPLGDAVNIASRVQGATKYLRSPVLVTQSTYSRIDKTLRGRRICSVRVQNINEPVQLYELAACTSDKPTFQCEMYEDALKAFEVEELSEALSILARLLSQDPNDGPAKLLMMRVIQTQLGGTFDPIWTLPGK